MKQERLDITPANGTIAAFPEMQEATGEFQFALTAPPLDQLQASLQQTGRLSLENVWACTVRILNECEPLVQLVRVADVRGTERALIHGTHWPTVRQSPGEALVFTFKVRGPTRFCAGCVFSPEILESTNG